MGAPGTGAEPLVEAVALVFMVSGPLGPRVVVGFLSGLMGW